jgi:hypothetical protein
VRLAAGLAAALLVGLAAVLALADRPGGDARQTPQAALVIAAPAGPGVAISSDPVGLSVEYPVLAADLGAGVCPPPALARAITALGSPTLRIGGDSQDQTAPAGAAPHAGASDLPRGFWARLGCLERETEIPIVVGLNLASDEPAWAATLAADARAAIPPARLSFELGNEPDIYGVHVPWWNGTALVHQPMAWTTYVSRAETVEAELGPSAVVEGPDFASGRWVARVPALVRALHLRRLDAHFYPLSVCRTTVGATSAALLSRSTQAKLQERVGLARDAHAAGLSAVISEANSISCGGVAGVSDAPAAAVWAVRAIVTALRDGFASVRFHSSGGAYDPFFVRGDAVVERPLYLGLRAAAAVLTPGSQLRAIPGDAPLGGVAIARAGGGRSVILSNYESRPLTVAVAARGPARVLEVVARAPTLRATTVAAQQGRVRVMLPANSVDAITVAAG